MDIQGTPGNDILLGTSEDDKITGRRGFDLLIGDGGDDVLLGKGGNDAFRGGSGADVQVGGAGDDSFIIGGGGDTLFGNEGYDTFIILPGGKFDVFSEETELVIDAGPSQHRFTVELAETLPQQILGLMFREDLAEDRGMLFDLGSDQPVEFSMTNTFISLDLIFIDADGTIANVAEHAVPLSEEPIASNGSVRAVLEVPAGTAATFGIGVGDRLLYPTFGTAHPAADDGDGGNAPRGGGDTIRDFTQGEDTIDLSLFGALTFADLDTDGDGVLDNGDDSVVMNGGTVIHLAAPTRDPADAYTLTIVGVSGLTADDFLSVDDFTAVA